MKLNIIDSASYYFESSRHKYSSYVGNPIHLDPLMMDAQLNTSLKDRYGMLFLLKLGSDSTHCSGCYQIHYKK